MERVIMNDQSAITLSHDAPGPPQQYVWWFAGVGGGGEGVSQVERQASTLRLKRLHCIKANLIHDFHQLILFLADLAVIVVNWWLDLLNLLGAL